jgi:hypothetical protein
MRRREMMARLRKFTCPYCGELVGCDELGKLGMYSLKIYNRHVQRCHDVLEAIRAGDEAEALAARDRLLRIHAGDDD